MNPSTKLVPASLSRWRKRLVLLAICCGVVIIGLGLVSVAFQRINAGSAERVHNIMVKETIPRALEAFHREHGRYPTTDEGLAALFGVRDNAENPRQFTQVVHGMPLDPWAQPYHYRSPGLHNPQSYDVWCTGPDRIDGTADDVGNWD